MMSLKRQAQRSLQLETSFRSDYGTDLVCSYVEQTLRPRTRTAAARRRITQMFGTFPAN